jgi:hypothetical protein
MRRLNHHALFVNIKSSNAHKTIGSLWKLVVGRFLLDHMEIVIQVILVDLVLLISLKFMLVFSELFLDVKIHKSLRLSYWLLNILNVIIDDL